MDERRKHGRPFWFAVVLIVVPILYVVSYGPACLIVEKAMLADFDGATYFVARLYVPLFVATETTHVTAIARWKYSQLWCVEIDYDLWLEAMKAIHGNEFDSAPQIN